MKYPPLLPNKTAGHQQRRLCKANIGLPVVQMYTNKWTTMDATTEIQNEEESSDNDDEIWIIYRGKESLDEFLKKNRPSRLTDKDATWISVSPPSVQQSTVKDEEDQQTSHEEIVQGNERKQQQDNKTDTEQLCAEPEGEWTDTRKMPRWLLWMIIEKEWKNLLENKHTKMVTSETLKELALKYGYTTGKWLIFASSKHIDSIWFTIAKAVHEGKVGISTKVSTKKPREGSHVICIYTEDFTDEDDVRKAEKGLRDLGIYGKMSYKADIYTILGIYTKNNLGICPTIFKSQAVDSAHARSIKDEKWLKETGNTKGQGHQRTDCIQYENKESLDLFIERNRPSEVHSRDAHWISVSYPDGNHHPCPNMPLIEAEWKEQQKKRGITLFGAEVLRDLAKKYQYTSGKWMLFTRRCKVDDLWHSIAKGIIAGRLGNEAKVSTAKPSDEDHVIYVYTRDFTDEPDVRRVERCLRHMGIQTWMSYKPDIYTSLRILAKNDFGIPPTIFTSRVGFHH